MVSMSLSSCGWDGSETRRLLFDGDGMRGQLLSELSLLAQAVGESAGNTSTAVCSQPFKLRLVMHVMEVASKFPAFGTLLLECPRRFDDIMSHELMQWLREESVVALYSSGAGQSVSRSVCRHISAEKQSSSSPSLSPSATNFDPDSERGCPICTWTVQWPRAFWEAVKNGTVKILVRCAPSAFLSCLILHTRRLPFERPSDAAIAAEEWIHVIGHVTGVFFLHRESADPAPMVEFQPLLSNRYGMVGQNPLWLDLSLLPVNEMRALAIVGERLQVIGLLEVSCSNSMGTILYCKRNHTAASSSSSSSSVQLVIEARAVRTSKFASHWSQDPLMSVMTAKTPRSFSLDINNVFAISEEWEAAAFLQARCSWETVAGAAAFASMKRTGGMFSNPGEASGRCRVEALLAASRVFVLPTTLWVAVGVTLSSASMQIGSIVASVVGSSGNLSVLQTFLLELAAETSMVVPLVHGVEGALLPTFTRSAASQVGIPVPLEVGRRVECVRGGLLNMSYQRILFAPSLHALTASSLHAIQGTLKKHEQVVVREGGQGVSCRAAGAFIGITQESMLLQDRQLFSFMERGDVVIHLPAATSLSCAIERDQHVILELLRNNTESDGTSEVDTFYYVNRCREQWRTYSRCLLHTSVDDSVIPQISNVCAALLQLFFSTAKATCAAEAVDAGIMTVLVKLTCAHALLRRKIHAVGLRGNIGAAGPSSCVCSAQTTEDIDSTAVIDALVAIALCDASLNFIAGVSIMGESFALDMMVSNPHFDASLFARELYAHLLSHTPATRM